MRGNGSIGLSTAGRTDQWSERVKAFRFCFPSSQMAKFGDELDYQFGYEDFAWTSILPSTAVFSIKLVPCILSMLFKKWLRNCYVWKNLALSFRYHYHRCFRMWRKAWRMRAARVFTAALIAPVRRRGSLTSACARRRGSRGEESSFSFLSVVLFYWKTL